MEKKNRAPSWTDAGGRDRAGDATSPTWYHSHDCVSIGMVWDIVWEIQGGFGKTAKGARHAWLGVRRWPGSFALMRCRVSPDATAVAGSGFARRADAGWMRRQRETSISYAGR